MGQSELIKKQEPLLRMKRSTPDGWTRVYWQDEAIKLLKSGNVEEISFDFILGDEECGSGNDVVLWIEEQVGLCGFVPPKISVHSANVLARSRMEARIRAIAARTNLHL